MFDKHYIRIDENNNIIKGYSTAFEQPQEGDICVNENAPRHFELPGFPDAQLQSMGITMVYNFKYENDTIVEKTNAEKYDTEEYVQALLAQKLNQCDANTGLIFKSTQVDFEGKKFSLSKEAQLNWNYLAAVPGMGGKWATKNRVPEQTGISTNISATKMPAFLLKIATEKEKIINEELNLKEELYALVTGDHAVDRVALENWTDPRI